MDKDKTTVLSIPFSEIKKNRVIYDNEYVQTLLYNKVKSGEFETYFDALFDFVKENDIDMDESVINNYISPSLRGILYREALDKMLLKDKPVKVSIESFF